MISGPEYLASPQKRLHDIVGAIALTAPALVAMPVSAGLAKRYCLPGQSPVIKQKRQGMNGQPFTIYKFRTMWETNQDRDVPQHSTVIDRRTDALGNTLRMIGADESAQLFNVVRGDMSVIGIRPMLPRAIRRIAATCPDRGLANEWLQAHHFGKPGIWGPGSSIAHMSMARREQRPAEHQMRADIDYVERASLTHDTKLFAAMPLDIARLALTAANYIRLHSEPEPTASSEV